MSTAEPCLNCGTPVDRKFCPECGQERKPLVVPADELLRDVLEEFLKFDVRLLHTLGTLFARPGELTRAFLAGRRADYLAPFKLYFTASFLFFLLLALLGHDRTLSRDIAEQAAQADQLREWLGANGGWLIALSVPWGAGMLKGLYRDRLYMEHLVFATHGHSLMLLTLTVSLFLPEAWWVDLLALGGPCLWTGLALRRFYSVPWWKACLHLVLLCIGYLVFMIAAGSLAMALAARGGK